MAPSAATATAATPSLEMFHDRDRAHASRVGNAHWAPDGTSCQGGSGEAAPIVPSGDIVAPMKTYIGRSVPRLEDPPLVRGRGRFAGDISFPHQLHMRLARAPVAHGRVVMVRSEEHTSELQSRLH